MLDSPTQTPILDWLDLSPELLSAAKRSNPSRPQAAVEPYLPVVESGLAVAAISAQSVLCWGGAMTFHQPAPMSPPPALGTASQAYRSLSQGGTQAEALVHLAEPFNHGCGW